MFNQHPNTQPPGVQKWEPGTQQGFQPKFEPVQQPIQPKWEPGLSNPQQDFMQQNQMGQGGSGPGQMMGQPQPQPQMNHPFEQQQQPQQMMQGQGMMLSNTAPMNFQATQGPMGGPNMQMQGNMFNVSKESLLNY